MIQLRGHEELVPDVLLLTEYRIAATGSFLMAFNSRPCLNTCLRMKRLLLAVRFEVSLATLFRYPSMSL
jgi:hypothetical protein